MRGLQETCLCAQASPWTSDEDLSRRGGVLVWNAAVEGDDLPALLRARFPTAEVQHPVVISYHRLSAGLAASRTGIAFVPPSNKLLAAD